MEKTDSLRMLHLIEDYLVKGQFHAGLSPNPHLKHCWELRNCGRKRCPAYGRAGNRCWHTTGTFSPDGKKRCLQFSKKRRDCRKCVVFQESTPTAKAKETELINNIVFLLNHTNEMLSARKKSFLKHETLTPREVQVFELAVSRYSRKEIASALAMSAETAKMHLSNLFKKLGVHKRSDLYSNDPPGLSPSPCQERRNNF